MKRSALWGFIFTGLFLITTGFSICDGGKDKFINKVTFEINDNLETATLKLIFGNGVQTDIGGSFNVKDYGTVDAEPSTPDNPFSVGFTLNLDIVNDNDYAQYEPTWTLPNGHRIPTIVDRPVAEVQANDPLHDKFDVYAYVDVLGKDWLGVSVIINYLDESFPSGLTISQNFLKDDDGMPRVSAAVFGPTKDDNGNLAIPGGIALFANVRDLIDSKKKKMEDRGEIKSVIYNGMFIDPTKLQ